MRGLLAGIAGLILVLAPSMVQAQPNHAPSDAELAAARSLFSEARELEKQDRWDEALPKLEAVAKVRMTPQVRFHIALCHEHLGKLVAARNGYEVARREAKEQNAPQVLREASERIDALKPRIPTIHIDIPTPPDGVTVTIDGEDIQTDLLAVPIPLDPGQHTIAFAAPGHQDAQRVVELLEGGAEKLVVELVPLPPPSPAPTPQETKPPVRKAPAPPPPPPPQSHDADPTAGWILVGAGGALLVGSAVSALVRASAISDIEDRCPSHTNCDPSLEDTRDKAVTYGTLAAVLGGAGAVTAGVGGYLVWSAGNQSDDPRLAVQPAVQPNGIGMSGVVRW